MLQCLTGFRASEILSLKLGAAMDPEGEVMDHLRVRAEDMKGKAKSRAVQLNHISKKILTEYVKWLTANGWQHRKCPLFPMDNGEPLTYWGMLDIYKAAFRKAGLHGSRKYATHTCRKTFAQENHNYLKRRFLDGSLTDEPIVALCSVMGHADIRATLHYLPQPSAGEEAIADLGGNWEL